MGFQTSSQLHRAKNEVAFKAHNERIQIQVENVLPSEDMGSFPVAFICECSVPSCHERIELSIDEFVDVRKNIKRFIIKPGHEQPDIELIIKKSRGFNIVEKYETPPTINGVQDGVTVA